MRKYLLYVLIAGAMLSIAFPVSAQTGCVQSPENPTAILALVGSAGALAASLRGLLRR